MSGGNQMKKSLKLISAMLCGVVFMSGCSMNDSKDPTDGEANKSTENAKKTAEKTVDDSIDNVMDFFEKQQVKVENMQPIENMEFAAYEGRTFTVDGGNAYLYRVKADDENMKKVMKEAEEKGKVKVSIDNKEMEYGASVNNGYLLLYEPSAKNVDILTSTFLNYSSDGLSSTNPSTLNPTEGKSTQNKDNMNGTSNTTNENKDTMDGSKETTNGNSDTTTNDKKETME